MVLTNRSDANAKRECEYFTLLHRSECTHTHIHKRKSDTSTRYIIWERDRESEKDGKRMIKPKIAVVVGIKGTKIMENTSFVLNYMCF